MAVGLVLGGGAPNLPLMSGALLALDEAGVEFDVVSTTGAGMLIGLLYAAPKNGERQESLKATRDMGVHDAIYDVFPVNFKIFHKYGPMAEAYTKFHQQWLSKMPRSTSAERYIADMTAFWMATFCPGDLSPTTQGLCQPPPWIDLVVDFDKLKDFHGEFLMSAYCVEDEKEVHFGKEEITADHFKAALAMPFIYAPYKLNGKTYLEGSAFDTLAFSPGGVMRKNLIDTIIYFDVLGQRKMIREPQSLYDAWVLSIINPLMRIAEMDTKLYEDGAAKLHKIRPLRMPFKDNITDEQWPRVLDWSHSNMSQLFDSGYKTGEEFVQAHKDILEESSKNRSKIVLDVMKELGVHDRFMALVQGPEGKKPGWQENINFEEVFKDLTPEEAMKFMVVFAAAGQMFEEAPEPKPITRKKRRRSSK